MPFVNESTMKSANGVILSEPIQFGNGQQLSNNLQYKSLNNYDIGDKFLNTCEVNM